VLGLDGSDWPPAHPYSGSVLGLLFPDLGWQEVGDVGNPALGAEDFHSGSTS